MTDLADIAAALETEHLTASLRKINAAIPAGVEGECDECGEFMPRLVDGRCGFCRDGRRPPLSFYADRADAPSVPASTTKEDVPMAVKQPVIASRKIEISGEALRAIEQLAESDEISFKQAANELIGLGGMKFRLTETVPPTLTPMSGGVLSIADTDELLDELRARFNAAAPKFRDLEGERLAALARAERAEAALARIQAAIAG